MDADRYVRVKEIFGAARALPEAERAALLARECGGDEALQVEVEDLLRHSEGLSEEFLQGLEGVAEAPGPARLEVPGFRMIELLDAGGSGIVYRAEQLRTRREVAIKVLRLDTLAAGQVARFQREAEILARLSHPGIAQVFEAGVAETGGGSLPWIAMEFVRGRALSTFVEETLPTPRAILELFIALCSAVDHAHGRGIVHRDLKPSNVLVDADGRPKVLDFGIARPLEDESASIEHTRTGLVMGTLAYMAPEQARGEREAIGVRADVYALGVMLFECLTGELPLDLDAVDVLEGVRIVSEVEPIRLRSLRPDLSEDLETIVLAALEKDPERRYASAGSLAGDLENLLADRPVLARRPTVAYQVRKFVRRNRVLTASASVVVLSLAVALAQSLRGLREARAQTEARSQLVEVLSEKLFDLSPRLGFGEELRPDLEEILAILEEQLEADPGNPRLRAALARALHELGNLEQARRDHAAAEVRYVRARVLLEKLVEEAPTELPYRTHLSQLFAKSGEVRRDQGDLSGRDAWFARALESDERLVAEHPGDSELLEDLGWSLARIVETSAQRGDHAEALRLALRRLADAEELERREPDNWKYVYNLSHAHSFLIGARVHEGRLDLADEHARESLRTARRLVELRRGKREAVHWLAESLRASRQEAERSGRTDDALGLAEEALGRAFELASGDPYRLEHLLTLEGAGKEAGELFLRQGRLEDASRAIERMRHVGGLPLRWEELKSAAARILVLADALDVRLQDRLGDTPKADGAARNAMVNLVALATDDVGKNEDLALCSEVVRQYGARGASGETYAAEFCAELAARGSLDRARRFARELQAPGVLSDGSRQALARVVAERGL